MTSKGEDETLPYDPINDKFNIQELEQTIDSLNNAAPGSDNIHLLGLHFSPSKIRHYCKRSSLVMRLEE